MSSRMSFAVGPGTSAVGALVGGCVVWSGGGPGPCPGCDDEAVASDPSCREVAEQAEDPPDPISTTFPSGSGDPGASGPKLGDGMVLLRTSWMG